MHPLSEKTLPNGLVVVVAPLPHLHTVSATLSLRAGSRYEPPAEHGLSHVVEHMIFRGTDEHPEPHELNLAIESIGGAMDAATHVDFVQYQLSLPTESFAAGLQTFSRIFYSPQFQGFEVEKAILREELLEDLDEDGQDINPDNLVRKLLFGEHPLGRSIGGDLDRIAEFSLEDLASHHARHYCGNNAVLSIAGPVKRDQALELAEACFGGLPAGVRTAPAPALAELPVERFSALHNPDSQTELRLCFPSVGETHPDAMALTLLERVLDDGLAARLHRRICDERGLSYSVFAGIDPYEDAGVFDFGATVAHEKVPVIIEAMLELLDELREAPVSEDELDRARRRFRWDLEAMLDDAEGVSSFYAQRYLFGRTGGWKSVAEQAEDVDPEDLHRVACLYLTRERARVACVGRITDKARRAIRRSLRLES